MVDIAFMESEPACVEAMETFVVNSTPDLEIIIEPVSAVLAGVPEVIAAYLYGSVARGSATPLSDVDLAVVLAPSVGSAARGDLNRRLITLLSRRCPGLRFEVRFLDEMPVALRGRVVQEGVRMIDRSPEHRVLAEVRARMDYFDFLPFERAGARMGLKGLREKLSNG